MGCTASKASVVDEHEAMRASTRGGTEPCKAAEQPKLPCAASAHSVATAAASGISCSTCGQGSLTEAAQQLSQSMVSAVSTEGVSVTGVPQQEADRLAALRSCGLLNANSAPPQPPPSSRLNDITTIVSKIFGVPIAVVSILDENKLYFQSIVGNMPTSCDRQGSFCERALIPPGHEVLVIEDTLQDSRFSQSPLSVPPMAIRFYAGAPLVASNGLRLGTLCTMDNRPRAFSAGLMNTLTNFAELVVRELEREQVLPWLREQERQGAPHTLLRQARSFAQGVALVDTRSDPWPCLFANEAYAAITGVGVVETTTAAGFWTLFSQGTRGLGCEGGRTVRQAAEEAVLSGTPVELEVVQSLTKRKHRVVLRPAATDQIQNEVLVGIPSFVAAQERARNSFADVSRASSVASELSTASTRGATPYWFVVVGGPEEEQDGEDKPGSSGGSSRASSGDNVSASSPKSVVKPSRRAYIQGLQPPFEGLRLGPVIGSGAHAKVYRAHWGNALVACKIIETQLSLVGNKGTAQGVLLEALLSKELRHPQIVRTFDYATSSRTVRSKNHATKVVQQVWILQRYCNRGTLYDGIDRGWVHQERSPSGKPDQIAILQTAVEIASALSYLASKGIVHGDISGTNVLLDACSGDGRVFTAVVSDFGLSQALAPNGSQSVRTQSWGTVTHQPPERLADGLLTPAADTYSLGVLIWEMWTGKRAWQGQQPAAVIAMVTGGQGRLELPADAPPALQDLCARCMHPDYTQRPSINAVLERLTLMLNTARASQP